MTFLAVQSANVAVTMLTVNNLGMARLGVIVDNYLI
jgi:hypothetical protein